MSLPSEFLSPQSDISAINNENNVVSQESEVVQNHPFSPVGGKGVNIKQSPSTKKNKLLKRHRW